jgi:co-chaperonin GroES (HSP10)
MKPIGHNIVIKTVDEEIRTSSGLLLSADDANQMRYKRGTVIAPGTDVVSISKDDDIYYDKRAGYTMLINNESYTIISLSDVVVVL